MPTGVMLGGLRAGETLTSAEHKKRNMANNLSENSKLRSRGGDFSLGEEEGHCNFQSSFVGIQAEPMEVVVKPRWLRELSVHVKSEDERQDVEH